MGDFETKNIAIITLKKLISDSQTRYSASLQLKRLQNCRTSKWKIWKKPYWCWATNFYKENLFWNIPLSGFIDIGIGDFINKGTLKIEVFMVTIKKLQTNCKSKKLPCKWLLLDGFWEKFVSKICLYYL